MTTRSIGFQIRGNDLVIYESSTGKELVRFPVDIEGANEGDVFSAGGGTDLSALAGDLLPSAPTYKVGSEELPWSEVHASDLVSAGKFTVIGEAVAAWRDTSGDSGANAGILFTAVTPGTAGNSIHVRVESTLQTEALSVTVSGSSITIHLRTSGGWDSLSTANEIIAAVNANVDAAALVIATNAEGESGAGIVNDGDFSGNLSDGAEAGETSFTGAFVSDANPFLKYSGGEVVGATLSIGDVSSLQASLDAKLSSPIAESDVTNLVDDLANLTDAIVGLTTVYQFDYDFSVDGGATGTIVLRQANGPIPSRFIVRSAQFDVLAALTGGAGAQAALSTGEGAGDLVAAAAVTGAPWSTTGFKATSALIATVGTAIRALQSDSPSLVVSVNALTAGRIRVWIEGYQSA